MLTFLWLNFFIHFSCTCKLNGDCVLRTSVLCTIINTCPHRSTHRRPRFLICFKRGLNRSRDLAKSRRGESHSHRCRMQEESDFQTLTPHLFIGILRSAERRTDTCPHAHRREDPASRSCCEVGTRVVCDICRHADREGWPGTGTFCAAGGSLAGGRLEAGGQGTWRRHHQGCRPL